MDFRNVEHAQQSFEAPPPSTNPSTLLALNHQILAMALYSSAAVFFAAGLWLLLGPQTLLAPELAQWVGIALVIAAVVDVIVVRLMKRIWANRALT